MRPCRIYLGKEKKYENEVKILKFRGEEKKSPRSYFSNEKCFAYSPLSKENSVNTNNTFQ